MKSRLTVQTLDSVPCDGQVRDYDQLKPAAKECVAEIAEGETEITVSSGVAGCFDADEIINYTNYLQIR